jgi:hypothetical protein
MRRCARCGTSSSSPPPPLHAQGATSSLHREDREATQTQDGGDTPTHPAARARAQRKGSRADPRAAINTALYTPTDGTRRPPSHGKKKKKRRARPKGAPQARPHPNTQPTRPQTNPRKGRTKHTHALGQHRHTPATHARTQACAQNTNRALAPNKPSDIHTIHIPKVACSRGNHPNKPLALAQAITHAHRPEHTGRTRPRRGTPPPRSPGPGSTRDTAGDPTATEARPGTQRRAEVTLAATGERKSAPRPGAHAPG